MQRQAAKHADIYGASQMEDKVKQHIKSCRETMTKTSFSAGVPKQLFCYISLVNLPSCKKAKKKKKKRISRDTSRKETAEAVDSSLC